MTKIIRVDPNDPVSVQAFVEDSLESVNSLLEQVWGEIVEGAEGRAMDTETALNALRRVADENGNLQIIVGEAIAMLEAANMARRVAENQLSDLVSEVEYLRGASDDRFIEGYEAGVEDALTGGYLGYEDDEDTDD
jgi:hypothetical protein